jgi:hypothetical protein
LHCGYRWQRGQVKLAPIVTPNIVKHLVGLRFNRDNAEDFGVGIQPFTITISKYMSNLGEALAIKARQCTEEYDLITNGSINTSLADAKVPWELARPAWFAILRTPPRFYQPQAQNILHHPLLGPEHVLTKEFQGFVTVYSNREIYYQGQLMM